MGSIEEMYLTGSAGEPMQRCAEVVAIAGRGLEGDRYLLGTGRFSPRDVCEVTLISAEGLEIMKRDFGVAVGEGQHRRNWVTRGIDLESLRDRRIAIGGDGVVVEYDRPRPPCGYLQRITEPGMTKAMGRGGAGIAVRVIKGGVVREGDALTILPGAEARPRRRLP